MLKKPVTWISLVVVAVIVVILYTFLREEEIFVADPLQAVPQNAAFVITSRDFFKEVNEITSKSEIWKELLVFPAVNKLQEQLSFLDSIILEDSEITELIYKKQATFSFHKAGKDRYEYIYMLRLDNLNDEKDINQFIQDKVIGKGMIMGRKYEDTRIYDIKFNEERYARDFSYTFTNGLFILSHSSILLEEAIRQLKLKSSLLDNPHFIQVANTAGKNVKANLYINCKTISHFISLPFKEQFKSQISSFDHFAQWSELDINIRENAILFNGFTYTDNSSNDYLNLVLDQTPQKIQIEQYIPESVSAFLVFGMEDIGRYKNKYVEYLDIEGKLTGYRNEIESYNNKYDINIEKSFYSFLEKEFAVVYTDLKNFNLDQNTFILMKTISRSEAEGELNNILEKIAEKEGIHYSTLVREHQIAGDINYTFYQIPIPTLTRKLFGNIFEGINNNYYTFYENYLIFGNSIATLSKYVHNLILRSTLASDMEFNKLSEFLAARSSVYFYLNIPRSFELMEKYLNDEVVSVFTKHNKNIRKFQAFIYQLASENDLIYNNIYLKYAPVILEEARTVWESRLDQPTECKPSLVLNHYTKEKEIFIQDKGNKVYLISNSGRILWNLQLQEKIMSDVYQIDYYKNGKLQLLFNTKNHIHLIDRNGNYVERYPVQLRAGATNGIALIDYDRNMDYRIFVATEDKKMYAYDKGGKTVKGWEFDKTEELVNNPVQHFRLNTKDYLVFADKRIVYILNRRGKTRVRVKEHFPVSAKNRFVLEPATSQRKDRLVITDTSGRVYFIYFDGNTESTELDKFSSDHYFNYIDLNGDGKMEYIFADGQQLKVFNSDKSLMYSRDFESVIVYSPVIYRFSATNKKIGIVSSLTNEIFLINWDGSVYKGFPLRGATQFSIGYLTGVSGMFNLVVGGEDNFLYNYSVK